jgi:uncharacterized membrane protein YgcG
MNRVLASAVLTAALVTSALPALAKDFVQDNAGMFSAGTISQLNSRITNFNSQTNKEVVVVTVPSAPNGDAKTAAENTFAQQSVNGVLIFVDKGDRQTQVVPDNAAVKAGWWSSATSQSVVSAINSQFKAGNFDAGITSGVNAVFDVYRSHLGSLRGSAPATTRTYAAQQTQSGGVHISVFWWIIIALFAFFIIRSLLRARSGMYYGGGYGAPPPGGPGYGPNYGPGYGYGGGWGGGGGFWSGLLGGLGGAWLGNELFGRENYGGTQAGFDPSAQQSAPVDGGGWQSDPGQADMSGGAGGGWGGGDMGGGFGGGDMGGGFGGGDGGAGGGW